VPGAVDGRDWDFADGKPVAVGGDQPHRGGFDLDQDAAQGGQLVIVADRESDRVDGDGQVGAGDGDASRAGVMALSSVSSSAWMQERS
jgi:hypothetical protein